MRLAVFTSKYPARVATFFERDMRALLEAGIDIEIFSIYPLEQSSWRYSLDILSEDVLPRTNVHHLSFGQSLRSIIPYPSRMLNRFLRDAVATGASAMRYGIGPFAKTAYVAPKAWAWSRQYADRFDHILAYWGNYAATCAYIFHNLINRPVPFSIWLHAGTDLYRTPVYLRQKLLYADNIITCCEFNRKFLQEHYPDIYPAISGKLSVYYHGLNFAEFPYEPHHRPPKRVIAVGRFAKKKGFDYLLAAAHRLKGKGFDVEIDFVGDGEEAASLKSLSVELGVSDRVRFLGWLPFNQVRAAMREAAVLVHPSDGLGDGLPNVIREAMAVGTPVIASEVAGIPEALDNGNCGILVPPRDVSALADAIERILTDSTLRRVYADSGRKLAEAKFDLWRNGARLAHHLRSINRELQTS